MSKAIDRDDEAAESEQPQRGLPSAAHTARPWPPRVYGCVTGGRESYQSDQQFAYELQQAVLVVAASKKINEEHRTSAVPALARAGTRQFVDLGCGYPSSELRK